MPTSSCSPAEQTAGHVRRHPRGRARAPPQVRGDRPGPSAGVAELQAALDDALHQRGRRARCSRCRPIPRCSSSASSPTVGPRGRSGRGPPTSAANVIWHDLECGSYRRGPRAVARAGDAPGAPVLDIAPAPGGSRWRSRAPATRCRTRPRPRTARRAGTPAGGAGRPPSSPTPGPHPPRRPLPRPDADRAAARRTSAGAGVPPRAHAACGRRGLSLAIAEALEPFDVRNGFPLAPLPDVTEFDGIVYSSRPLAVRERDGHFVLERRRETVTPAAGLPRNPTRSVCPRSTETLEAEGAGGVRPHPRPAGGGRRPPTTSARRW